MTANISPKSAPIDRTIQQQTDIKTPYTRTALIPRLYFKPLYKVRYKKAGTAYPPTKNTKYGSQTMSYTLSVEKPVSNYVRSMISTEACKPQNPTPKMQIKAAERAKISGSEKAVQIKNLPHSQTKRL